MRRLTHLRTEFVQYIPEALEHGVLYVSRRYSTASHLCCCGCGVKVVTPLNLAKWRLSEHNGRVSLHPSVGNWGFPCQSHYWIEDGAVRWAGAMSPAAIAAVKARDRHDAQHLGKTTVGRVATIKRYVAVAWAKLRNAVVRWWK